ncbi:amidase [Streptomyces phaeoluteigriseus]|uniref:Amidase n=1 Tax=Streptomyces phaeoluteigriseus TaxID=114686 RepID=A0ABY4ZBK5_9ACTN|nr:amidase [Streptomyces phaeoluteigriseus]USQ86408.1 amidase [Streptomyces phaeoluteigriseus]
MATPTRPTELWQLSATELASAVRSREVSSVDLVRSCLDRIEATNPRLNALVDVRPEEALAGARRADEQVASGAELGPLHGVPVSIKINTEQRGHATSNGVAALAHRPAEGDAACVTALRTAGAVPLGRSNSPAFSFRWFSTNDLHGRTLNPWDAERTPGGSSGGAASSLAAGMTPLAQGNDIGGSIRFPAACCGVVGVRPTVGRISDWAPPAYADTPEGLVELDFPPTVHSCAVQGPLARTVADARLALHAMTTPDLRDSSGVPAVPPRPRPAGPVRVDLVRGNPAVKNHPAVDRALDRAAAHLTDAGYEVDELADLPLLTEAARLWALLITEDIRPVLPLVHQVGGDDIRTALDGHFAAAAALWGERPTLRTYIDGWARRATLITRLQELLGGDRLLLTPVCAEPAFEQDADITDPDRALRLFPAMWPMTAVPVLGFPAVTVPVHIDEGLPFSAQLIGGRFEEDLVLDAAQAIEDRAGVPPLWA